VTRPDEPLPARLPLGCDFDALDWYAVIAAPRRERQVARDLVDRMLWAYCPLTRRWARGRHRTPMHARWVETERPLFTRYVFVGFSVGFPAWHLVHEVDDIERVVSSRGMPLRIPGAQLEVIHDREMAGAFDEDARPRRRRARFAEGDRVIVDVLGVEREAIVQQASPRAAKLMLEVLGAGLRIAADPDRVKLVRDLGREETQSW